MIDCSHRQFALVWMQLEDALDENNGFGGNVAEVYLYLVTPYNPALDRLPLAPEPGSIFHEDWVKREEAAVRTIYEICRMFAQERHATISWEHEADEFVELYWNDDDDGWIYEHGHRLHIMVDPRPLT